MLNYIQHVNGLIKINLSIFYIKCLAFWRNTFFYKLISYFLKKLNNYLIITTQYSSIGQHRIMVGDKIRTNSYYKAIKHVNIKNKIVLDAGCGIGIFGFLSSILGAKKVFAVDQSSMINTAKKLAKINKINNIKFIQQDLNSLYLPQKVDVILHETIGNFLFNENTVNIINHLKKNVLIKKGQIIPYQVDWYMVPISLNKIGVYSPPSYWLNKLYNFDFSSLAVVEPNNPITILLTHKKGFLSKPQIVYSLDYQKMTYTPKKIQQFFFITKNGQINGILGYFKIRLDKNNYITTEPSLRLTHWGQMYFPVIYPTKVKKNNLLKFRLVLNNYLDPNTWQYEIKLV